MGKAETFSLISGLWLAAAWAQVLASSWEQVLALQVSVLCQEARVKAMVPDSLQAHNSQVNNSLVLVVELGIHMNLS